MTALPPGLEIRGDKSPPGASPATRGRGLFATRRYEPGQEIAVFSKPLVVLPSGPDAATTCNYCLDVRRQPVKLCTGCHAVAYCGPSCQRAHWSRFHKVECKALKKAYESAAEAAAEAGNTGAAVQPLPTPVRALVMLILQWTRSPEIRAAVERLESNTVAFINNRALWDDFKMQAAAACKFAEWFSEDQIKTAVEIMCRVHTNSFDRRDPDLGLSGMFLDPSLAMVNHACLPTAVVAFVGQKAYLRAQQPIAVGDEITISYIDFTKPRSVRQQGLVLYNFSCSCRRCVEDLDVYQVCQESPVLSLNAGYSLVPDLDLLRNPPILRDAKRHAVTPQQVEDMYVACQVETSGDDNEDGDRIQYMRRLWRTCHPLVEAKRWAVEPLAHVVRLAIMHYTDVGNYAHVLAFACFGAQNIDPYKYPAPFATWRVKGLLMIAKALPHIMPVVHPNIAFDGGVAAKEARGQGGKDADPRRIVHSGVLAALPDLADGGLYEALMLMVLHNGPLGHSAEWPPLDAARHMLADVQSAPDHESITAALNRWFAEPTSPEMAKFFNDHFMTSINKLSALALEILEDLIKE